MQVKQSASWKDLHWIHLGRLERRRLALFFFALVIISLLSSKHLFFPVRLCLCASPSHLPPFPRQPQPALSGKLSFLSFCAANVCLSVSLPFVFLPQPAPLLRKSDSFGHAQFVGEKKLVKKQRLLLPVCCRPKRPTAARPADRGKKVTVQVGKTT